MAVESGPVAAVLPVGAPCWVELATGDDQQAVEFYAGLFGWQYRAVADSTVSTGRYLFATRDGFSAAGIYQTDRAAGWVPHIAVSDTGAAAARAGVSGGAVTLGPLDLPRYDSIAYAEDPTGAPVVLRTPPAGWSFTTGAVGTFAGADLNTRDGAAADDFYFRMFGYQSVQIGDGVDIDYAEWRLGGQPVFYRYVMGPEYSPATRSHWVVYFVADPAQGVDDMAVNVLRLGGTIVTVPYDTRLGRVAVFADRGGATFSVIDRTDSPDNRRAAVEDPDDE
jgi:uncharacterized protein